MRKDEMRFICDGPICIVEAEIEPITENTAPLGWIILNGVQFVGGSHASNGDLCFHCLECAEEFFNGPWKQLVLSQGANELK